MSVAIRSVRIHVHYLVVLVSPLLTRSHSRHVGIEEDSVKM